LKDGLPSDDREFDAQTLEKAVHYLFLRLGPRDAMLECCDLISLKELLRREWDETDIDYRTSELEEAVNRVIELSSTPNYAIGYPKILSAREVIHRLDSLEWALGTDRLAQKIDFLLDYHRNESVWSWLESMLRLFIGYLYIHFTSYLPSKILKSFEEAFSRRITNTALSGKERSDEYTPLESGLNRMVNQLEASYPHYREVLLYQQRLVEIIEKSRRYGDTLTRRADRNEISDYLNQMALSELGTSFNELCFSSAAGLEQDCLIGQVLWSLEFFFQEGELPEERDNRRGTNQEILESIREPKKRDKRRKELEVEENRIQESKKDWVEQLQNESWRDFGRLSPLETVDLTVFSQITELHQASIAHKAVKSLLGDFADGSIREVQALLKKAKKVVCSLQPEMPRIIVILGDGADNYGNYGVWFADRFGSRRPETSKCLEWACFSSEIDLESFQQLALIPPRIDDNGPEYLIDPVIYPLEQIEAYWQSRASLREYDCGE
jgi:hypothetical protein